MHTMHVGAKRIHLRRSPPTSRCRPFCPLSGPNYTRAVPSRQARPASRLAPKPGGQIHIIPQPFAPPGKAGSPRRIPPPFSPSGPPSTVTIETPSALMDHHRLENRNPRWQIKLKVEDMTFILPAPEGLTIRIRAPPCPPFGQVPASYAPPAGSCPMLTPTSFVHEPTRQAYSAPCPARTISTSSRIRPVSARGATRVASLV